MSNEKRLAIWLRRIKNLIPRPSTVARAISLQTSRWISKLRRLVYSFSPYLPQTPFSTSMDGYPGTDMPLVVKIESYKNQRHFHGGAQYGDIIIDSDNETNTTDQENFIQPLAGKTSPIFFIMSPEKLGLNAAKLTQAMQSETLKKGDYDYYADNCIDHVIRPIKKAGARIDFGCVSTPKELAQWCDQQCQKGNGILVDLETYKKILAARESGPKTQKKDVKNKNKILNQLLTQADKHSKNSATSVTASHPLHPKTELNSLANAQKDNANSN